MNKKQVAIVAAIGLVAGAIAGGTFIYLVGDDGDDTKTDTVATVETTPDTTTSEVACPADAKQCPDGSFVGRTAPDCEFAPCPELPPLVQAENIKVYAPAQGATITTPVTISGEARVFEGTVNYRILDGDGNIVKEGFTTAASLEMGEFGPYSIAAEFTRPPTGVGKVQVFNYSARDGSVENLVTVLVVFG